MAQIRGNTVLKSRPEKTWGSGGDPPVHYDVPGHFPPGGSHAPANEYLEAYIKGVDLETDPKGPLFRTAPGKSDALTRQPLSQADAYRTIRRRAKGAGIYTKIGNHTFRATGITAYLRNGGRLEVAQQIAAHESSRTTGLYDRRGDEVSLDEVELIFCRGGQGFGPIALNSVDGTRVPESLTNARQVC